MFGPQVCVRTLLNPSKAFLAPSQWSRTAKRMRMSAGLLPAKTYSNVAFAMAAHSANRLLKVVTESRLLILLLQLSTRHVMGRNGERKRTASVDVAA